MARDNKMEHISETFQLITIQLLLSIAAICELYVTTLNLKQSYLQYKQPLVRYVYIFNAPGEFEIEKEKFLQLLETLTYYSNRDINGTRPLIITIFLI